MSGLSLVSAANRCTLGEAIAAVNGPVTPRFEWNLSVLAALGANSRVHVAYRTGIASAIALATVALRLAGGAATRATPGLIGEASGGVVLLVINCEDELGAAIDAR